MEPATLSPLIKRLEGQGRLIRARRADDERVLEISLTGDGVALRRKALEVPGQIMQRVGMEVAELEILRDSLARFSGTLTRVPDGV